MAIADDCHMSHAPPAPVQEAMIERRLSGWVLLAAVGCFAALAIPFFFGQVYIADDLGEFHLPLRDFYARQLAGGEPFDWMPGLFGGFYVTGEGQLGAYHPLHLLLYRWLPLGAAFDLELLASYPLMFAGTYWFLQRWLARRDTALFGALVFTFGGFNLLHFVHPNAIAIVAHIPWLLLAIDVALVDPRRSRQAIAQLAVGLLTTSQLLLGYPQYVWFSLLIATAYAAWRTVALRVPLCRVAVLTLCVALGTLTAAVQWLPTLDVLRSSTRATADDAFANSGALHPLNLVQWVAPYLFRTRVVGQNTHELGLYAGAVPLVLCVWLLAQHRRWGRLAPLVWACLVFAALALALAMGDAGGLYRLQAYIPLANNFRFPCRAIVLVQWSIAILAAAALAALSGHDDVERATRRRADRALAATLAASVMLAVVAPLIWPEHVASMGLVWCGPLLVALAVALVMLAERNVPGAIVAMVLLTAIDLTTYGLSYSVWNRTADLNTFVSESPTPPSGAAGRVAAQETSRLRTGNRMLLAGMQRVDGYAGLEPARRLDYTTKTALRAAGAAYLLAPRSSNSAAAQAWLPLAPAAPRVRLVSRAVPFDVLTDLDALGLNAAALDEPLELPKSAPGSAHAVADRPGHLVVECRAPAQQLLVTTESFHDGWRATIDGRDAPVVRVNGDFLGCVVDAGKHAVELQFRPRSLLVGEWLSAGGLGLLLCTFAWNVRPRKPSAE
jgi:hypothetical protein